MTRVNLVFRVIERRAYSGRGPEKGCSSRFGRLPIPDRVPTISIMKVPDPKTERAVRAFLDRAAASIRYERAILYGSRARGDYRVDSDADLALIMHEHADEWPILSALSGLAFDVFLETGVLIQPVPISSEDWAHPDQFPRPSFLRNVAREGIDL
jgi:uncharacterized protein